MSAQQTVIDFKNVALRFGSLEVHSDLNFSISKGESVTILGPSGTGKTVILKMIIGLLEASAGTVRVLGSDLTAQGEDAFESVRKKVGMLFQGAALFDSLSVYENIAYSLREREDLEEDQIQSIVEEKLALVAIPGIEEKFPPQLSGGQKKRVGLARALASSPDIMLFDEPTTGLDPTSIRRIDDLIVRLNSEFGVTCISVTHDIESAKRISNRWILLDEGTVVADGPVSELTTHHQQVIQFVHGEWDAEDQVKT